MTGLSLVDALGDLGIEFPAPPELGVVLARLETRRMPRRRATRALALAVGIAAAVTIVVAPARRAVADWLGIGAVRIVQGEALPPDLDSSIGDLGVEFEGLAPLLEPFEPLMARLGPARTYLMSRGGGIAAVSLVWLPSDQLPEVGSSGVGALFTRFAGSQDTPIIEKTVGQDTAVTVVAVGDARGYWIAGAAHAFVYLDPDGEMVVESLRLGGNTLLWESHGFGYRLESGLDLDQAMELAVSIGG